MANDVMASTAAMNTTGIPTLILVPLVMAIAIASVALVIWLYKKLTRRGK